MDQNSSGRMSTGQRIDDIKASIPGTKEYEMRHGYDKAHANMQNLKARIPGTSAHHGRYAAGSTTAGSASGLSSVDTLPATGAQQSAFGDSVAATGLTGAAVSAPRAGGHALGAMPGRETPREPRAVQAGTGYNGTASSAGAGNAYNTSNDYAFANKNNHRAASAGSMVVSSHARGMAPGHVESITSAGSPVTAVPGMQERHGHSHGMTGAAAPSGYNGIGYSNMSPERRHSATRTGLATGGVSSSAGVTGNAAGGTGMDTVYTGDRKKVAFDTRYDNDTAPGHFRDQGSYRHGATSPTLDNRARVGYQRDQGYATHGDSAVAAPYGHEAHEHKSMGTKLKELLPCTQEHKLHKVDQQAHGNY